MRIIRMSLMPEGLNEDFRLLELLGRAEGDSEVYCLPTTICQAREI